MVRNITRRHISYWRKIYQPTILFVSASLFVLTKIEEGPIFVWKWMMRTENLEGSLDTTASSTGLT